MESGARPPHAVAAAAAAARAGRWEASAPRRRRREMAGRARPRGSCSPSQPPPLGCAGGGWGRSVAAEPLPTSASRFNPPTTGRRRRRGRRGEGGGGGGLWGGLHLPEASAVEPPGAARPARRGALWDRSSKMDHPRDAPGTAGPARAAGSVPPSPARPCPPPVPPRPSSRLQRGGAAAQRARRPPRRCVGSAAVGAGAGVCARPCARDGAAAPSPGGRGGLGEAVFTALLLPQGKRTAGSGSRSPNRPRRT